MSSFGESFAEADEILTLIALIPVAFIILVMALNFDNPNFDAIGYFELGMRMIAYALIPAIGATLVLGGLIHLLKMVE